MAETIAGWLVGLLALVFVWWVKRRLTWLERRWQALDAHLNIQSQRLDVHSLKAGLMTQEQLDAIHDEMPNPPTLWDRESLKVERETRDHGLGP